MTKSRTNFHAVIHKNVKYRAFHGGINKLPVHSELHGLAVRPGAGDAE